MEASKEPIRPVLSEEDKFEFRETSIRFAFIGSFDPSDFLSKN